MDAIDLDWGGKVRPFRIRIGEMLQLQEACGTGIGAIYFRLVGGQFRIEDVQHTLRLGLIGGGHDPSKARILVQQQIEAVPLMQSQLVAAEILETLFSGVDPAPDGDDDAAPDPDAPVKFSDLGEIAVALGIPLNELRTMRYDDLLNTWRAYAARRKAEGQSAGDFITPEEHDALIAKHEGLD